MSLDSNHKDALLKSHLYIADFTILGFEESGILIDRLHLYLAQLSVLFRSALKMTNCFFSIKVYISLNKKKASVYHVDNFSHIYASSYYLNIYDNSSDT